MRDIYGVNNPFKEDKVTSACSIFGVIDTSGKRFSGEGVIRAMSNMRDRGNGLGGGFAVYGLYPQYADCYAFHIMYLSRRGKKETEGFLKENFKTVFSEEVPTRPIPAIKKTPIVWRYFLRTENHLLNGQAEEEYIAEAVMTINTRLSDSFVFSSGRDMAVFKGVGYPEDIAEFFCLEQYQGYLWTAHSRFPTNSSAWWGGAHPFGLLNWTVVHNGEISSYGINRRYLETFGYRCTMETDTEVITYAIDLLVRKHNLPIEIAVQVLAPPFWSEIERLPEKERELLVTLRQVYGSLLLNGPFAVIIAREGEMIGLTDRIRLRPLIAASKGSRLYLSSEESAIRLISPELDKVWLPVGGWPVVARLNQTGQDEIVKTAMASGLKSG